MSRADAPNGPRWRALTLTPEFNVAVFALLLNFPWEFLQSPLFAGMATAPHGEAVKSCTRAALGDALIALAAHSTVAAMSHNRRWLLSPARWQLATFVGVGLAITVVIEWLALNDRWIGGWRYAETMPVVPGLGIGLSPLLQWVVLPLLTVWFVRRQTGREESSDVRL
jgi:hypothetical protein